MKKILPLAILVSFISCSSKKQLVFYAFTDGFMDWYKLELFHDHSFNLHIPSTDYSGFYGVDGDTIFLNYNCKMVVDVPKAYLINNEKMKIDELLLLQGNYEQRKNGNRWIQIVKNDLPKGIKKPQ